MTRSAPPQPPAEEPAEALAGVDISPITDWLYISAWPEAHHAAEIAGLGIRLIITMHWKQPHRDLHAPPVATLRLPTIDSPFTPIPVRSLVRGVETALPVIRAGHGVLVHCQFGRHRSVAMACCILIGQGMSADAASQLVKQQRPVADPYIWYIAARIHRFEAVWRARVAASAATESDPGANKSPA